MRHAYLTIFAKLAQVMVVALAISFAGFCMFQFAGDPVVNLMGPETTEEQRTVVRQQLGLDQPVYVQFIRYVARAAQGDFGVSYTNKQPVLELIANCVPATLEIVLLAMIVSTALAVPLGAYCAVHRRGPATALIMATSILGVAIPTFLLALGLVLIFSVGLSWLPSFGRGETEDFFGVRLGLLTLDGLKHAIMPALVMCLFQLGVTVRLVRGEMLEALSTDFVRFCRARGLPSVVINRNHALRNTLVPLITTLGIQFSTILSFSVVTERVFQWPGVGQLLLQAIENADVPVLSAYLVFVGVVFMVMNALVDLAYYWLDPRLRTVH